MAKIKKGLVLCYDKKKDVLYLSLGEPRASVGEEIREGVFLNKHPKSGKIAGITVLDFESRFTSTKKIKPLPIEMEVSYHPQPIAVPIV